MRCEAVAGVALPVPHHLGANTRDSVLRWLSICTVRSAASSSISRFRLPFGSNSLRQVRTAISAGNPSQITQSLRRIDNALPGSIGQPLFQCRCKLHASQAVQVKVLAQSQVIFPGRTLAGNLRHQRVQPIPPRSLCIAVTRSVVLAAAVSQMLCDPLGNRFSPHFTR